jgi:hypothetical protein
MIMGIGGPLLILMHSTFQVGSLNAAVALYSMLLVAGSGVVGRFIYVRVHRGLSRRGQLNAAGSFRARRVSTKRGALQAELRAAGRAAPAGISSPVWNSLRPNCAFTWLPGRHFVLPVAGCGWSTAVRGLGCAIR